VRLLLIGKLFGRNGNWCWSYGYNDEFEKSLLGRSCREAGAGFMRPQGRAAAFRGVNLCRARGTHISPG
jgi:hypothetical protein